MNKKIAAFLAIALLISLSGCGGNSAGNDVPPSSNIESQSQPETPETPPGATSSADPSQDTTQNQEPAEVTQTPAESDPAGSAEPTTDPTKQPEETTPTSTSAPATSTPAHTHNYTSTITKQATCGNNGILTYTCSCNDSYTETIKATGNHNYSGAITKQATCAEEGVTTYTCAACGTTYTEAISRTAHNWTTRHIDEVGHMASTGTHIVRHYVCACGNFDVWGDDPDYDAKYNKHYDPFNNGCGYASTVWKVEKPNDPTYVVDTPAHDETYCTICGTIQ